MYESISYVVLSSWRATCSAYRCGGKTELKSMPKKVEQFDTSIYPAFQKPIRFLAFAVGLLLTTLLIIYVTTLAVNSSEGYALLFAPAIGSVIFVPLTLFASIFFANREYTTTKIVVGAQFFYAVLLTLYFSQ